MTLNVDLYRFKDGRELRLSNKFYPSHDDQSASLTISDIDLSDAGVYTCEVFNQHGHVKTTAILTVNGER